MLARFPLYNLAKLVTIKICYHSVRFVPSLLEFGTLVFRKLHHNLLTNSILGKFVSKLMYILVSIFTHVLY